MRGLSQSQLQTFDEYGYLVVPDVLGPGELSAIQAEYEAVLEEVTADLVQRGALRPLRRSGFSDRYVEALEQLDDMYLLYQHLDISLPLLEDLDESANMHAGAEVFRLITNPRLLDIVESVIGSEIYSNPVQHARIKPPRRHLPEAATDANIAATMWHQDAAVIEANADETNMLTVWLAITDATRDNGCLVAVPGSHRRAATLHCPGKIFPAEIYIPDAMIEPDRVVSLEVGAGGVVLLHKLTEHASLENTTDSIRWSFDLRYQPVGEPTGREVFPGFVARSHANPSSVLTDPVEWAELWWQARDRIARRETLVTFGGRWDVNASQEVCA